MKTVAYLKTSSPFYKFFPKGKVPIKSILADKVELEGFGMAEVYFVALDEIGSAFLAISEHLAHSKGENVANVLYELQRRGLPLRVSETTGCSSDVPWFL